MLGWRGGRWQLGLACRVEAVWRVGGVLLVVGVLCAVLGRWWRGVVSHVRAACWGAIGDDSHARGGGNILQHSGCGIASRVGGGGGGVSRVMSGQRAGAGRLEMTRVLEAVAQVAHVHKGTAMACSVEAVGMVRVE
ncbi:hypothetical protein EDB86DRAFT_2831451 [Lactarius hatsudake]|nr:hypothetical protein EDB86DRAFT_2831451 [Lactarius hatsudake]